MENGSQNIVNREVLKVINISDIGLYEGQSTVSC